MSAKRKKLRWLLSALGVFATVALLAWTLLPHHRINKASFDQIKEGVTKAEVESLFGVPPGIHCRRSVMVDMQPAAEGRFGMAGYMNMEMFEGIMKRGTEPESCLFWISFEGACVIDFDADGNVQIKRFCPVWAPSIWQRVKDWFAGLKR